MAGRRDGRGQMILILSELNTVLVTIRLVHTLVWVFFVGCILLIPVSAATGDLHRAAALSTAVLVECGILALNQGRCPLTDWARRYTDDRSDNFDIYLPLWLARYNKAVFGSLFLLFELYLVVVWIGSRR